MEIIKKVVSRYVRNYSRKLKDGTLKEYSSEQVLIRLSNEDDLENDEEIYILKKDQFNTLQADAQNNSKKYEKQISDLQSQIQDNNLKIDVLQGQVLAATERSEKSWALIAGYQRVLTDVKQRGFLQRLRNQLPESYNVINEKE